MPGIQEQLDLGIQPALSAVDRLEARISKLAADARTHLNSAFNTSAGTGFKTALADVEGGEASLGRLGKASEITRKGIGELAREFTGNLGPGATAIQGALSNVGGEMSGLAGGPMLAVAAGAAAVGVAIGKMAIDGIKDVVNLASEVRKFSNVSGLSAEESSKWVAAAKASNVSAETLAAGIFKLSNNVNKHAATLEADGIQIARNAQGHVDLGATLSNLGEAYQKAGKGAEGNKVLFDSMGRSGAALIPILSKSKEQLDEFFKSAEAHHEILTQADLDKVREYKLATHDLGEAFSGVQRELGLQLIPLFTVLAKGVTITVEKVDKAAQSLVNLGKGVAWVTGLDKAIWGVVKAVQLEEEAHAKALTAHEKIVSHIGPELTALGWLVGIHYKAKTATEEHTASLEKLQKASDEIAKKANEVGAAFGIQGGRIQQLAKDMGIDLVSATDKETKKLDEAIAKIGAAITPTQRLADQTKVLGNVYSTTKELVDSFKDALDATLGSHLAVDEKLRATRGAVFALGEEFGKGRSKGQGLLQYQDQLAEKLAGSVRAIVAENEELVRAGIVSADAAARKKYLRDRLADLEAAFPSLRTQIVGYIADIDKIPQTKTTDVRLNLASAMTQIEAYVRTLNLATTAGRLAAEDAGKSAAHNLSADQAIPGALADALAGTKSLATIATAGEKAGKTAATSATKTVEKTLLESSKAGGALDIGGFMVKGIQVGLATNQVLANNAVLSLTKGMADVVKTAQLIDPAEQLNILNAIKEVAAKSRELTDVRKKLGAGSIEAKIAELELGQAQAKVNTAMSDAKDASKAVTKALDDQKAKQKALTDSLNATRDAFNNVNSVIRAQRSLLAAEKDRNDLLKRQAQLPGEIQTAEQKLAASRAADASVTNRESLAIVQARQNVAAAKATLEAFGVKASSDDILTSTLELTAAKEAQAAADAAVAAATTAGTTATTAEQLTQVQARTKVADATKKLKDMTAGTAATTDDLTEASLKLKVAQEDLAQATKDSTAETSDSVDAAKVLKDLQDEQASIVDKLRDATDKVTDSQNSLLDAQLKLIEAGKDLKGLTPDVEAFFRSMAAAAGISGKAIDEWVQKLKDAAKIATGGLPSTTTPGSPAPLTSYGGAPISLVPGSTDTYTTPGGPDLQFRTPAAPDNLQYRTPVAGWVPPTPEEIAKWMPSIPPGTKPGGDIFGGNTDPYAGQPHIVANFYPQQAVMDPADMAAALARLELLGSNV